MDIFVHVGMQKTGTTAMQKVFEQIEGLQYFHYMDWYTQIKPGVDVLFSNEDLSGHPYLKTMDRYRILENIKTVFPDAKIIVGFRNELYWFKSIYKESVCQGYSGTEEEFLNNFKEEYMDFERYETVIRSQFKDVFVYTFEELNKDFDKVIRDLCKFMDKKVPTYTYERVNPSLKDYQIKLVRLINKFFKGPYNPNGLFRSSLHKKVIIKLRGI